MSTFSTENFVAQVYFCRVLHGLLNVTPLPIFVAAIIFGPFLAGFYFRLMLVERDDFNCSRFMEIRSVILMMYLHVVMNLMCRFFFVVHADRGLVVGIREAPF